MQIPIIPHRGQAKPYGSIPRINWDHPLAKGLVSYAYDVGGVVIDLVGGKLGTKVNGTPVTGTSPFGSGVQYPAFPTTGAVVFPVDPRVNAAVNTAPY